MLNLTSRVYEMDTKAELAQRLERKVGMNDVTVVLPVLNEEEGLGEVLDEVLKCGYQNVLVIDGYSTDNTAQVAQSRGVNVVTQHGRGKTGAIRTAIENISTPYLLVMDGDYTYDANDIERFLPHASEYEQIVGSRQSKENVKLFHRLGNRIISIVFNLLFGTSVSDVCSGMYLLNSKAARQLSLRTRGFSVEVEVLAQMALHGRVTEVPITYRKRLGKPKLVAWVHGIDILKSIVSLARVYNPVFLFSLTAASAAIPGLALLGWVLWSWWRHNFFHLGWALTAMILLLVASQAFIIGTISVLLKSTELRIERLVRSQMPEPTPE